MYLMPLTRQWLIVFVCHQHGIDIDNTSEVTAEWADDFHLVRFTYNKTGSQSIWFPIKDDLINRAENIANGTLAGMCAPSDLFH